MSSLVAKINKPITRCQLPKDEIDKRISALRESDCAKHAAIKMGIHIQTMQGFVRDYGLQDIIGTRIGALPEVVKSLRHLNKASKRRKEITEEEVVDLLIQTGSIARVAVILKIRTNILQFHCKNLGWTNYSIRKYTYFGKDWKNPYKVLEALAKKKTRTNLLAKKLFDRRFLIPVCGFQNTPQGINYDHKDGYGGWNCPHFGPSDYEPEEPFMWGDDLMTLGSGFELDHIDGDGTNDHWKNLRVLCMLCHSMTPTFRWKKFRRKGYKPKK